VNQVSNNQVGMNSFPESEMNYAVSNHVGVRAYRHIVNP
jgi:hypothetical protein